MKPSAPFLVILFFLLAACAPLAAPEPTPDMQQEGLKPADSDTPAAGICGAAQGDITRIELGAGPDGLPLAGRCLIFTSRQRIQLVNGTDAQLTFDFARYSIDLPAGGEMLLDKPVGEFLALGVHFLPHGPEIWVK